MKGGIIITAGRQINTQSQEWCTPQKYVSAVNLFFENNIELDPCGNEYSIVNAKIRYILPTDGLKQDWNFKTIYINPPYGRDKRRKTTIKDWIKKCYYTNKQYKSEILLLIPVATNTSHWKEYIFGEATAICFLYDTRLKFRINGSENNKGCPMSCCMVYYGCVYERFEKIFSDYGFVMKM